MTGKGRLVILKMFFSESYMTSILKCKCLLLLMCSVIELEQMTYYEVCSISLYKICTNFASY